MKLLYVTHDEVGLPNQGAGQVTVEEITALKQLGEVEVWDRKALQPTLDPEIKEPWCWDEEVAHRLCNTDKMPDLVHFYSGTFSESVEILKQNGIPVTYTCFAHDIEISKKEHEKFQTYNYPHLTDPELWRRYSRGYRLADVLIAPSTHSASVLRKQGCTNRIEMIPHGVHLPAKEKLKPPPKQFMVGYLGAIGGDKGLFYLAQAWKKLNYKDAILRLAGRDTTSPFMMMLASRFGGGNIHLAGWQNNTTDFYNGISLYCAPSATEGFHLEGTEAMAHGRPVLSTSNNGMPDVIPDELKRWAIAEPSNTDDLANRIEQFRKYSLQDVERLGNLCREHMENHHTWDKVYPKYVEVWKELLD